MFSNIIYFVLVLLIYNIGPEGGPAASGLYLLLHFFLWLFYAFLCRREFARAEKAIIVTFQGEGSGVERYQRACARLSTLAVVLFGCSVYFLNLKGLLPGPTNLSNLKGIPAICVFLCYLSTMWWFGHRSHCIVFGMDISRRAYLISQLRLNLPILFPWVAISLLYDLLVLIHPGGAGRLLNSPAGHIGIFALFLVFLMAVMPKAIQSWWGCIPLEDSEKKRRLESFLKQNRFRYREILGWPLLEGRTLTAGIMGIIPRYRYILITDALYELLSLDELKAVLAHEMGHAKYKHMLIYLVIFVGYAAFSYGFFEVLIYALSMMPVMSNIIYSDGSGGGDLGYVLLSLPMAAVMILYFRYVMGFFMRNFERQADLYSATLMGGPDAIISSLEKIAYYSGKSRDVPSWHHFSIRERVEILIRSVRDPALLKRHNRMIALSFALYLFCVTGLSYGFSAESVRNWMLGRLVIRALEKRSASSPADLGLKQALAVLYHQSGKHKEAAELYEAVLNIDPKQTLALNNLAWLLVTSDDPQLRDPQRGLALARKAAELDRSPVVLDTLAEAFYANNLINEALEAINEALTSASERREYYLAQREKITAKLK